MRESQFYFLGAPVLERERECARACVCVCGGGVNERVYKTYFLILNDHGQKGLESSVLKKIFGSK